MSAQIIDARGIFEARMVCVNATRAINPDRIAGKMLSRHQFNPELEKRIKAGTLPKDK